MEDLQKNTRDEADFLFADKDESFLQHDSITLGVRDQACRKYSKKTSLHLKESVKDEVDFSLADIRQRSLQLDTIILGACPQACPNYPKQQVCYFFAIF